MFLHFRLELVHCNFLPWTSAESLLFWWWWDMTKTFRGSQKQGSHSTALICRRWSSSTMLRCRRARDQMFFFGFFFSPAQAAQPSSLLKCVSYALEGKERQRKIPYFYDPFRGLTLIIIPVTDQNWELLILIIVLLRWRFISGGTVSTSQGQDWLHRQTTNQKQLLQMPCKCHTSQTDVKYWSGSAKRVLTPNCSTISPICSPDIGELPSHASFVFFDMPSVIFPRRGLRTRGRWSVLSVCGASHVPLQSY